MRRLLVVLGENVSRSLSPLIHTAAAARLGLDVAYAPVSCATPERFHRALDALRDLSALGANVTNPYKLEALARAEVVSDAAREIGAVNTLTFLEDGRLEGDNTDGPGLLAVLQSLPRDRLERVQVLGAGGAARGAAWALWKAGVTEARFCARRDAARALALPGVVPHPLERVAGATLVISTLPGQEALADAAISELIDVSARPYVYDAAYGAIDRESPLLARARARGLEGADGRSMLVEQGARSLARWTGAEVSRIRAAMFEALGLAP